MSEQFGLRHGSGLDGRGVIFPDALEMLDCDATAMIGSQLGTKGKIQVLEDDSAVLEVEPPREEADTAAGPRPPRERYEADKAGQNPIDAGREERHV